MPGDKAVIGARLRAEREDRVGSREEMARRLRAVSDEALPNVANLAHMIKAWEKGKHSVSERYQALYASALGMDERTLFGGRQNPTTALWRGPDGWVSPGR